MTVPQADTTGTRRRIFARAIMLLSAATLLAIVGLLASPIIHVATGRSIGTLLAEQDGHLVTEHYASASAIPTGVTPVWLPDHATALTVVRPGPSSGLSGAARADADVPPRTPVPTVCSPATSWSMPFNVPKEWPALSKNTLFTCGEWTLGIRSSSDHWYFWTETAGPR